MPVFGYNCSDLPMNFTCTNFRRCLLQVVVVQLPRTCDKVNNVELALECIKVKTQLLRNSIRRYFPPTTNQAFRRNKKLFFVFRGLQETSINGTSKAHHFIPLSKIHN